MLFIQGYIQGTSNKGTALPTGTVVLSDAMRDCGGWRQVQVNGRMAREIKKAQPTPKERDEQTGVGAFGGSKEIPQGSPTSTKQTTFRKVQPPLESKSWR